MSLALFGSVLVVALAFVAATLITTRALVRMDREQRVLELGRKVDELAAAVDKQTNRVNRLEMGKVR